MRRILFGAPTIKVALVAGFGVTLGLWLFSSYSLSLRMTEVERGVKTINDRYTRGQELLSTVQGQVLLGSVYVRDFLLDTNPGNESRHRERLIDSYRATDRALDEYRRVSSATELLQVDVLLAEIANFRATIDSVLGRAGDESTEDPRSVLTSRVAPAREAVIRASEDARAQNRSAFIEQQSSIPGIVGGVHRQALVQLGLALAASFGIALLATVYASRLESRLVQKKLDLQQLSAKVIHAQEEERRTIARELHDEIGQAMSAVKVELAVAQTKVEQVGASVGLLDDAQAIADTALRTVRDLSQLLHPGLLDDLGLVAALDWYVRGFSRRNHIPVALDCDIGDGRLVANIEANVYRIVQEALTNVARHSRATDCRVSVRSGHGKLVVVVEDNGVGFDPAELERRTTERGLGLIGIRERAGELLGIVRLESSPGTGTRLTVELPFRARRADPLREQREHEVMHA